MVAINDRVKETTTTTGQGTVDLDGAKTGFETFLERIGNGNQTYYCIAAEGGSEFEVGIGTVSSGTPNTLSRDTVLSNSDNNTNKVTFSAGTKEVFCTLPASKAILEDSANNMNVAGSIIVGGTVDGVDIATRDGVLTATATTANAALPKAGGTMTGNIVMSGSETVDGVDISARDAVLTSTTTTATNANTTANAALPKAGGTMTGDLILGDNVKVEIGAATGGDLELFHDSNNSFIKSNTGTLKINSDSTVLRSNDDSAAMANFTQGGAVELFHNGSKKAETVAGGLTVTGTLTATTLSGAISGNISQLTNNSGYVTSSGVTSVATGNGLSGGTITSTGTLTMSGSYSGSFSASSNITAYSSDERLKDFKGKIDNALDKVDQLNGYYFEWNDVAKGLDGGKSFKEGMEVGVSAQEIEKVLPEVVTEAPIVKIENLDVDYKTVYYDKIVPLLIEAIKELRAEVKKLKEDK